MGGLKDLKVMDTPDRNGVDSLYLFLHHGSHVVSSLAHPRGEEKKLKEV